MQAALNRAGTIEHAWHACREKGKAPAVASGKNLQNDSLIAIIEAEAAEILSTMQVHYRCMACCRERGQLSAVASGHENCQNGRQQSLRQAALNCACKSNICLACLQRGDMHLLLHLATGSQND